MIHNCGLCGCVSNLCGRRQAAASLPHVDAIDAFAVPRHLTDVLLRYTVPTGRGSSGSPKFDGDWRLVALHHAGDPNWSARYNQDIPVSKIATKPKVAALLQQQE